MVVATPTSLRNSTSSTTSSWSSLSAPTLESDRTRSKTLREEPRRCASDGTSQRRPFGQLTDEHRGHGRARRRGQRDTTAASPARDDDPEARDEHDRDDDDDDDHADSTSLVRCAR